MWSAWRIEAASHTHTDKAASVGQGGTAAPLLPPSSCSYMPLAPELRGAAEDIKGEFKSLTSSAASASL